MTDTIDRDAARKLALEAKKWSAKYLHRRWPVRVTWGNDDTTVDHITVDFSEIVAEVPALADLVLALLDENEQVRAALAYYADGENWDEAGSNVPPEDASGFMSEWYGKESGPNVAREALGDE